MKIYGVFAPSVPEEDLRATTAKMSTTLRSSPWHRCNSYTTDGFAIGRISSSAIDQGVQPIWNEGRTRLIVGVGRIFEYDQMKRKLARAGHQFRYPGSDAEFVLHAFEEWGEDSLKELNGTFVFAMYDSRRRTLTIANDRYGMRPVYYYYGKGMFVFASEVKAIIEDGGVPREIDWSAWRDFFSYRYLLGTKTFFKGIFAIPNASLLSIDIDGIRQKRYWSYNQIQVDHEKSESYFVAKGARLIRQAIERQSVGLEECVVLLSGGYDSRCIASAIRYYTDVNFETYTTRNFGDIPWDDDPETYRDGVLARQIAKLLDVRNTYVPTPSDLWPKYFAEKVFLVDGMSHEHLWAIPLIYRIAANRINFDGIAGGILLKGAYLTKDNLRYTNDHRKLARVLHQQMLSREMATETISQFFRDPICEKLRPDTQSVLEALRDIGSNENIVTIFFITNRTRNAVSLLPNNIISRRAPCLFPFLDNDLVEFSLTIPPEMKVGKELYFRILRRMFPEVMKVPPSNFHARSHIMECGKRRLLLLMLCAVRYLLVSKISCARRSFHNEAVQSLLDLLDSLAVPEFVDVGKIREKTRECLSARKDPSPFLVSMVEFCIWYDKFFAKSG